MPEETAPTNVEGNPEIDVDKNTGISFADI